TDHDVRAGIVERHSLHGLHSKVLLREGGREGSGKGADTFDGFCVHIRAANIVAFPQEVDDVSTFAASGVEDAHSGRDAAFQKLVEEIDIDLAELFLERERSHVYEASQAGLVRQETREDAPYRKVRNRALGSNVLRCRRERQAARVVIW